MRNFRVQEEAAQNGIVDFLILIKNSTDYLSFVFKDLFIYLLRWVFVATHGFSLVVVSRDYSCCDVRASRYGGFSSCRAQALGAWASVVVACGL